MEFYTPTGSQEEDEYQVKLVKGEKKPVKVGKKNIAEEINAYAEEYSLRNMIKRLKMGDPTAINQNKAQYLNLAMIDKSIIDLKNREIEEERYFNSLPTEAKELFDNSVDKFMYEVNLGTAKTKIDEKFTQKTIPVQEPNIENKVEGVNLNG